MAKGRYGPAGNGAIRSRFWKENMIRPAHTPRVGAVVAPLTDPQGRVLDYLRLAVTDRCNLRCRYCMPADGIEQVSHADMLTMEELLRLGRVFVDLGIRKIRVTGGEPLVRKGVVSLLAGLRNLPEAPEVLLTTNGLDLSRQLDGLQAAGVERINLSLDSLHPETWSRITRRDGFEAARASVDEVLARGMGLKINMVVLPGWNDHELPDFVALTLERDLTVRFIEPMPFLGAGEPLSETITGDEILGRLEQGFALESAGQTGAAVDRIYRVRGYRGRLGIIAGASRTFCSACSRLRLDGQGRLRTCLYGIAAADLRMLVRQGATDAELGGVIRSAVARRQVDGRAAEQGHTTTGLDSMASIGG